MNTSTDFKALLGHSFSFGEVRTWPLWLYPVFVLVIFIGLEIVSIIVPMLFKSSKSIPIRGKHLDQLESTDKLYILINKFATALFVFHFFKYTTSASNISWAQEELTLWNTFGSFIAFYAFYDFFYMWFHRILHRRSIYGYIHKHHHR
jgi:sterol desaturase/sphingolipid hydroxylase (fatty acid hydroxylase superfamily)